jgi:hypothetical protein
MRVIKITFGVLCFGLGVAFAMGAVNALLHPGYAAESMDVAFPAMLGAMFLLGSFLLLRRSPSAPPPVSPGPALPGPALPGPALPGPVLPGSVSPRSKRSPGVVLSGRPSSNNEANMGTTKVRDQIFFFVALTVPLIVGAAFSKLIYDNSAEGVAYLAGQFLGIGALLSLIGWSFWRRSVYATGAVVLLIATLSVGGSNARKLLVCMLRTR